MLRVIQAFGDRVVGESITDSDAIAAVLESDQAAFVVRESQPEPEPEAQPESAAKPTKVTPPAPAAPEPAVTPNSAS